MKNETKAIILFTVCLFFATLSIASAQEIDPLKGMKSVKAVFDVRIDNPKSAALHLKLIDQISTVTNPKGLISLCPDPSNNVLAIPGNKLMPFHRFFLSISVEIFSIFQAGGYANNSIPFFLNFFLLIILFIP